MREPDDLLDPPEEKQRPPQIEHKAKLPTGNIPRNRQFWLMATVAVVIVLAVIFSGSSTTAPKQSPVAPMATQTTSPDAIINFEKRLKEEEARLQLAQDQARRAKTDYRAMNAAVDQIGIPGQAPIGPSGRPEYPPTAYQPQEERPEPIDPLVAEQKKKEYQSLFSSNVALSFRPKETNKAEPRTDIIAAAQPVSASAPASPTPPPQTVTDPVAVPAGHHKLFEGQVLESVLVNRLEGDFAGPVNCMITTNVYSHNGQVLLIPQGSRVLGEARKVSDRDQNRLAVVFHRLIMPDGFSVNLDQMLGLDQAGATALKDKVNHHYLAKFGTSIMLGLLAGFSMYNTQGVYSDDSNGSDVYRQGVANQLSRDSTQILGRQLNRMPDITIREGLRVKLLLSKDLVIPGYKNHPVIPGI